MSAVSPQDTGYLTASKFTRLSAAGIEKLKPVTILLKGDKPVAVVVKYEEYLKMQDVLRMGDV